MKHKDLISRMTLEEKAALLSGGGEWESRDVKRLDIPSFIMSDGPHGIRRQAGAGDHLGLNESLPATCFPTAATVANSWNEELGEQIGQALGKEAADLGVDVVLGPGLNIKRSPLCGRNFEYFSEDPYLAGKMAAAYVKGIQSEGVYACPKHFAVNSQEERRMAMNAVLDERTLREIYLTSFEIAVKEGGAKSIMSAYNEVNGIYANENKHLLKEILRDDWGFDGIVISDWGASNDHVDGVRNGADLEMPGCGFDSTDELVRAVREGKLSEQELEERVDCMLDAMLTLDKNRKKELQTEAIDMNQHHELAKRAAAESLVLLKNEDSILPMKQGVKVAVIGDFAFDPRYQGAGSSLVNATKVDSICTMIESYQDRMEVIGMSRGYQRLGHMDEALQKEAIILAEKADVVLYFFGLNEISESEGMDRMHMNIPQNQIDLLTQLANVNQNIVGILSAGAPVEMPWQNNCKAILHGYLTGQAGAGAILDTLVGYNNPSGKLNESYPMKYEDTPAYHYNLGRGCDLEYREAVFVGYRYYLSNDVQVQFPFGYGLSYTQFSYNDPELQKDGIRFKLKNIGDADGAEVVQMYVALEDSKIFRPARELKGFQKVFLKAGEEREVFIPFDDKTFRYWNIDSNRWEIEGGKYRILVGSSCMDIRLSLICQIAESEQPVPYRREELECYYRGAVSEVSDQAFESLLGRKLSADSVSEMLGVNDAFCQLETAKSRIGRLIYRILLSKKIKSEEKGTPELNILFVFNMPFRALSKLTAGMINKKMVNGLVDVMNGHFFRGIRKMISGFFANRKLNREYQKLVP